MAYFDNPIFNLKAVVKETGLKPDTLRVWERRYGLPSPSRSEGKHRLYSQRDINILKWLMERQNEGLSISHAVEMWHQLESKGNDPLEINLIEKNDSPFKNVETMADLRQAWMTACLNFDEMRAEHILAQGFSLYPLPVVCFELVQKGLAELGRGWLHMEVSVQQEHFASALVIRWLEALIAATPAPTRPGKILLGCPAEEEHVIPLLLLNLQLRRQGYEVIYLGANTPFAYLENTLQLIKPDLVVLTAQTLPAAANLLEVAQLLHRLRLPLAFGGFIFNTLPSLQSAIPGYFLGEQLEIALQTIETFFVTPPPPVTPKAIPSVYHYTLLHLQEHQPYLDMAIWQAIQWPSTLKNQFPSLNIIVRRHLWAALKLGDMALLSPSLNWLTPNITLTSSQLKTYWWAYHEATQNHLGERGQLLQNWLELVLHG